MRYGSEIGVALVCIVIGGCLAGQAERRHRREMSELIEKLRPYRVVFSAVDAQTGEKLSLSVHPTVNEAVGHFAFKSVSTAPDGEMVWMFLADEAASFSVGSEGYESQDTTVTNTDCRIVVPLKKGSIEPHGGG